MKSALAKTPAHDAFMNAVSPGTVAHFQINRHYKTLGEYFEALAAVMRPEYEAIVASGTEVVTVGLRRIHAGASGAGDNGHIAAIQSALRERGARLLPNTAGCRTAREAIELSHLARELYDTPWIKLEVVGDEQTLQPDPWELVSAAEALVRDGFEVFPYCTDDLVTCHRLLDVGCQVLMPWGAPIGSGQGLINPWALRTLRERWPDVPMVVDAGIGSPAHAVQAMELGYDAVLLNSAVSQAREPVRMAAAFGAAVQAGRAVRQWAVWWLSRWSGPPVPRPSDPRVGRARPPQAARRYPAPPVAAVPPPVPAPWRVSRTAASCSPVSV